MLNSTVNSLDVPTTPVPVVLPSSLPANNARCAATCGAQGTVELKLPTDVVEMLRCPRCHGGVQWQTEQGSCTTCELVFPISRGVPILIDPGRSLFDLETFTRQEPTFFRPVGRLRGLISRYLPDLSMNVAAGHVFARLRDELHQRQGRSKVLVVGGGVVGGGMECLLNDPRIQLIETDAAIAPRTQLICDGHDLPFADASVDAVIVQAVLEHVVDPHRCVAEIHRVLKADGLVYSDTPFMQQVHGRQFDFTRFTRLGHRRLFRHFEELDSGMTCGPAMALGWNLRYFLMSFCRSPRGLALASASARVAFWWLKYLDRWLVRNAAANDGASAFYFLGRRSDGVLSDRDLVASYQGGH